MNPIAAFCESCNLINSYCQTSVIFFEIYQIDKICFDNIQLGFNHSHVKLVLDIWVCYTTMLSNSLIFIKSMRVPIHYQDVSTFVNNKLSMSPTQY